MRATVTRKGRFYVDERPIPEPGAGDVLVKVRVCGICGSDLHYVKHIDHIVERVRRLGQPTADLERGINDGVVLGHEFVCEIVDFGPQTQRTLKPGDRVCSMPFLLRDGAPSLIGASPDTGGAYAQYMLLTEAMLLRVDEEIPDEAAALVEPVGIAVHAVNKAHIGSDDVAVIVGCGPIGLALIAVLKARGVRRIVASDLSPKRRELAGAMGADVVVDARAESVVSRAAAAAPAASMVIFENTGAPGMLGKLVVEAPQNARIVVTGIPADEESFLPALSIMREHAFIFVIYYTADEFAEALDLVRRGAVDWRPLITGKVGLDGVAQAFTDLADPERHAKILIDPWI